MMFSRTATTKVMHTLALAMFLAWVGHTFALLAGAVNVHAAAGESASSHGHSHDVAVCMLCIDHPHPPMTADHVHETPYLAVLPALQMPPQGEIALSPARHRLPEKPVYLIERPPRPGFVF